MAGERTDPAEAADYHAPQVEAFAAAGADLVAAYTLTGPEEAVGVVRAARAAGVPVAVPSPWRPTGACPTAPRSRRRSSWSMPTGDPTTSSSTARTRPTSGRASTDGAWRERVLGVLPNASTMTHAELDAAEELDDGDPAELAASTDGSAGPSRA